MLDSILFFFFPAVMVFAGSLDLLTMKIPNRVCLAMVAGFVLALPFAGLGWWTIASHVGAGALMLVVGIGLWQVGGLGGGDAKLLAAAALWIGLDKLFEYILLVTVSGGILVLAILVFRGLPPPLWLHKIDWAMRLHQKGGYIPYGIALAMGGLWIYPATSWFSFAV